MDNIYFAYKDNFKWGKQRRDYASIESQECLFPSRIIFELSSDDRINIIWTDGLDLLGIPCD